MTDERKQQSALIAKYVNDKYPHTDEILKMWLKRDIAVALYWHEHISILDICECIRCMMRKWQSNSGKQSKPKC